jgi:alpha-glucosidase (family GH31 glycosyl hydrolase)
MQYIALRYQLKPYVSTLFKMLQSSGRTILRGLFFDFSNDPAVVNGTAVNDPAIVHQYMFGASSPPHIPFNRANSNGL